MAATIKKPEDIEKLRIACKKVAEVVRTVSKAVKPGVTTAELDDLAFKLITENSKDVPAFLNYKPFGAEYPFPASICISVNDEVVHGIPGNRVLEEGDIVSLDCGVVHDGMISDHAITVPCGKITEAEEKLIAKTKSALLAGIKAAKNGKYINDISKAIEKEIGTGYGIVRVLCGHGVGYKVHEEPFVPNYDDGVRGPKLVKGMVLALEPMLNLGTDDVDLLEDGYTFVTADGAKSAHFEHTILITDGDAEILTV
jgi:methionyl aminopeptidase